jgi:small subunit ribosomal protein S19e
MEATKVSTVKDVLAAAFITEYSQYLKKTDKLEIPAWVDLVKTGKNRILAPYDNDWLYVRTAAVARKIYLRPGLGVSVLKKMYGGSQDNGTRPDHFAKGSGKVVRYCLKQLERLGLVQSFEKGSSEERKGRFITKLGQIELNSIARQIKQ